MRRGLLALLALIGASSMGSAQAQFVPPPGLTIQTTTAAAAKVSADAVVTRLMTFDHNNDGRVTIGELSERMHPVVARGDKNGDGALDRLELQALAVAPLSVPTQRGRGFGPGGYSFGDDAGLSSRTHIEGALEDLRLASDKKDRALPIVRAYVDTVEQAAKADLLSQMERLLSPEQLIVVSTVLNADQHRQLTFKTTTGDRQVFVMNARGDLAARVDAMHLGAPKDEQARKAIDQFKTRIRLGNEPDRSALLAQLQDILSDEERDNYGAALARRPVVANGPSFFALNDAVIRTREFINVVKPAVLIEQQTPVTIISR